ncbi:MAG: hypothetical protein M1828_005109 [Chrysothrix sp. TS-e1954]|nr:MAG: hypothetical protein M1828_005109 [Chrysothrix sp. TS-e1954]
MVSLNMKVRWTAAAPLLFTGIAIILSFLCVFAGTNHDMIEDADIFMLNTSRIGINFTGIGSGVSSGLSSLIPRAPTPVFGGLESAASSGVASAKSGVSDSAQKADKDAHNAASKGKDAAKNDVNKEIQKLAKDVGLHDFYSIHILNFCEGYFKHNSSARNVTHCSGSSGSFSFNPNQTLGNDMSNSSSHLSLDQIHWPKAITEGIRDIKWVFQLMFVLYCFGLVCICFAFLANIAGVARTEGRLIPLINVALAFLAFFWLIIASGAVTYAGRHATDAINKYGKDIDVNARRGTKFLGMTWAAVTLVGLSTICWVVEFFMSRRLRRSRSMDPSPYMTPHKMQMETYQPGDSQGGYEPSPSAQSRSQYTERGPEEYSSEGSKASYRTANH